MLCRLMAHFLSAPRASEFYSWLQSSHSGAPALAQEPALLDRNLQAQIWGRATLCWKCHGTKGWLLLSRGEQTPPFSMFGLPHLWDIPKVIRLCSDRTNEVFTPFSHKETGDGSPGSVLLAPQPAAPLPPGPRLTGGLAGGFTSFLHHVIAE